MKRNVLSRIKSICYLLQEVDFGTFSLHMSIGVILVLIVVSAQFRFIFRNTAVLRFKEPQDVQVCTYVGQIYNLILTMPSNPMPVKRILQICRYLVRRDVKFA